MQKNSAGAGIQKFVVEEGGRRISLQTVDIPNNPKRGERD
jgi:hypothetical protein